MTTHRQSQAKEGDRDQRLEQLLIAMGINDDPFARYALVEDLKLIEHQWTRWKSASGKPPPSRDRLLKHRELIAEAISDCEEIGHDFLVQEIEWLGFARLNPDADVGTFNALMADLGHRRPHVVDGLVAHLLDVDRWLEISETTYRKRNIRKQVVEPFLRLMDKYEVNTSRKQRPRKKIFDALFDWLGVGPPRPTGANIKQIADDLKVIDVKSKTAAK
ncbi:hypothetical protein [Bradyrhizobium sp. AUGA SZCCT0042]|uniref:hypothetical protein n=1 Tax=Bradyrhizobium sp. AUGA SZCCT0042 TaxID=2807651 RepID=UPI001BADC0C1|nr:hypothetical protein [Bradyrhizobium sp. AUGA SZCCT0042]MBR1300595.1 hypothetical protein [Bradyrhizobium sp. AUGA SZCCT0042]